METRFNRLHFGVIAAILNVLTVIREPFLLNHPHACHRNRLIISQYRIFLMARQTTCRYWKKWLPRPACEFRTSFQYKMVIPDMWFLFSWDRLILVMEIFIVIRRHIYIGTGPWCPNQVVLSWRCFSHGDITLERIKWIRTVKVYITKDNA